MPYDLVQFGRFEMSNPKGSLQSARDHFGDFPKGRACGATIGTEIDASGGGKKECTHL